MNIPKRLGLILAGVWFLLHGLFALVPALHFQLAPTLMALLALAAGVLILLDR